MPRWVSPKCQQGMVEVSFYVSPEEYKKFKYIGLVLGAVKGKAYTHRAVFRSMVGSGMIRCAKLCRQFNIDREEAMELAETQCKERNREFFRQWRVRRGEEAAKAAAPKKELAGLDFVPKPFRIGTFHRDGTA